MKLTNSFELKTGTLEELNSIVTQPGFKGTIANLPAELYHKCAGVSRSTLSDLEQSFAHFEERRKNPKKPTKDMIFGSAFHDFVLLPTDFEKHFAVDPIKEEGTLETIEHLKSHLAKFIDTSKLKEELEGLEHSLSSHEASSAMPHPLEEELAALKSEDFPAKKDFTAKQKELKDVIKEFQAACKNKANVIKAEIKTVKDKIQSLESQLSGNKPRLIANVRQHDKEVKIWDEIIEAHEKNLVGKQSITREEFARIKIMSRNVRNHPTIKALSQHVVYREQTFFWHDTDTGLLCKCRPDETYFTPNMILPNDYKTTDDASLKEFQRTIGNFEYHIQASYYLDGINAVLGTNLENFLFTPAEKQAPHELAIYALDSAAQEIGRAKYKKHLKTLLTYEPGGENHQGWKGYPIEIQNISIPAYLMVEA